MRQQPSTRVRHCATSIFAIALSLVLVLAGSNLCQAGTIVSDQSLNSTGVSYSATFEFTALDTVKGTATLVIEVTNTSKAAVGGALTGFAFNNPGDRINDVTLVSNSVPDAKNPNQFDSLFGGPAPFNKNNVDAPGQYGGFDIGIGTGANLNGGNVNDGIPVGKKGTFELELTGDFTGLTTDSFQSLIISALSDAGKGGDTPVIFAGRFQGLTPDDPGSDVAVTTPEPGTMTLALLGVAGPGLYGLWRRRRQDATEATTPL